MDAAGIGMHVLSVSANIAALCESNWGKRDSRRLDRLNSTWVLVETHAFTRRDANGC